MLVRVQSQAPILKSVKHNIETTGIYAAVARVVNNKMIASVRVEFDETMLIFDNILDPIEDIIETDNET